MHNGNLTDLYIQNQEYVEDFTVTAENISIGYNVTDAYAKGDVCIPDKIKVNLNAKESIEITNGFICEKGATLTINAQ